MERTLRKLTLPLLTLWAGTALGQAPPAYVEREGRVVIEVEAHPPTGQWTPETALEGFTGKCYYTWRGRDAFRSPGGGVLSYVVQTTAPGKYELRIRNRHDFHDSTLQNDCFTRMDDGPWVKTFSSKRGEWTFRTNHEHGHKDKPRASYELTSGRHLLQISGRSQGFSIDRIHLYRVGDRDAEDPALRETRVETANAVAPQDQRSADGNASPPEPSRPAANLQRRLLLAKRFIEGGDAARAAPILEALIAGYPDSAEAAEAAELLKKLDR